MALSNELSSRGHRPTSVEVQATCTFVPGSGITTMALDANGLLASIANPAHETVQLTYFNPTPTRATGLLKTLTDPRGSPIA